MAARGGLAAALRGAGERACRGLDFGPYRCAGSAASSASAPVAREATLPRLHSPARSPPRRPASAALPSGTSAAPVFGAAAAPAGGRGAGPRAPPGCRAPPRRWNATDVQAQFDKQLMPEDILHLRAMSMTIMQDPVCELRPEEVHRYHFEHPDEIDELPLWHPRRISARVTQPNRKQKLAVVRYSNLIIERIDNDPLCNAFSIDAGFNMQVYFAIIHAWLLHQRLVLEGSKAKRLDEDLFESCWTLVRNWMWLKKIPEYRFDAELQNVQEYMLGFCVALDKALERPDILPGRLQQTLWANVYSGGVKRDAAVLSRLTKYCLRQLGLMLHLEADRFLAGNFVWADFPLPDDPPRAPLQIPAWRQEFNKVPRPSG